MRVNRDAECSYRHLEMALACGGRKQSKAWQGWHDAIVAKTLKLPFSW